MMKRLMKNVNELVSQELEMANTNHPPFHSTHEGYAVLLEEFEESDDEIEQIRYQMDYLWDDVKTDNPDWDLTVDKIRTRAVCLACEAIQVAAMCDKFRNLMPKDSHKESKEHDKPKESVEEQEETKETDYMQKEVVRMIQKTICDCMYNAGDYPLCVNDCNRCILDYDVGRTWATIDALATDVIDKVKGAQK